MSRIVESKAHVRLALAAAVLMTTGFAIDLSLARAESSDRPNIVLVMADDQGWGDVGFRDHDVLKTPVLDEMAATCLRLDRFYAAAPVCSPTRGSVMTGRHPNRFGCFSWGHTLRPQEITIAEALKTVGYSTGHFGKWHLGPVTAESPVCPGNSGFDQWVSAPNFFENDSLLSDKGKVIRTKGESSEVTVDLALDFIGNCVEREQPFLAVVWFGSPHSPHIAAEEFRRLYEDQPKAKQHFYGEITGIDAAVGKLRRELRELKIADNTLLWYTSDNGALPVGSTGGLRGKKGNLYEGGIRVPCMIEWPARIKKPRATDLPFGTVDIYPTLLAIAGVKMPDQPPLDGVSMLPLIEGDAKPRNKPLGFWVHPTGGISTPSNAILQRMLAEQSGEAGTSEGTADPSIIAKQYPEDSLPGHAALISGNWKLHRIADKSGDNVRSELYDLAADSQEKNNVADDNREIVEQLAAQLEAWQTSVVKSLNGEDYKKR